MAAVEKLAWTDALGQAELVRKKEISAAELVEAAISRIEDLNPRLNAVITPMYEHARERARSPGSGPFAGVPFLLKDLLAEYAGFRFTQGTAFLRDYVSKHDTELVKRLKRCGLIVVGKTNAPELGVGPTTEPRLFGPTRNPWDLERTPGGSSGGSAAAVAAGLVPMAHGNDAGGSIRVPASCCGVFGLKPTRARNPLGPDCGDIFSGLVAEHALTRSVRDSAALLDATSAADPGDPYWAPPPRRPFLQEVGADPGALRLAFTARDPLGRDVDADAEAAVASSAELCAGLGHEVVEASPDLDFELLWKSFTTVLAAGFCWIVDDLGKKTGRPPAPEFFEPFVWAFVSRGRRISASEYLAHVQVLQQMTRRVARFFRDHDVWLTPTTGSAPVPLGTFAYSGGDPFEVRRRMAAFTPFTYIANATGQPAMSVPLHWNGEGMPLGSQFVARFGDEATLLRLAAQLEEARPWSRRRPPVAA